MLTTLRYLYGIEDETPWDQGNTHRLVCAIGIYCHAPISTWARLAYIQNCNLAGLNEGTVEELIEWVIAPTETVKAYARSKEPKRFPVAPARPRLRLVTRNYGEAA